MILLLIGLSVTGTTALATLGILGTIIFNQGSNTIEQVIGNIASMIVLIPFWIIGISLIIGGIKGIKKMKGYIKDYKTNPTLYGKIYNSGIVEHYGEYKFKLDIAIYDYNTKSVISSTEYLFERDKNRFRTGVYVQLKQIGDRYIIEKRLLDDDVPSDILIELSDFKFKDENGNKIHKDTVVVNGVEYVRKK